MRAWLFLALIAVAAFVGCAGHRSTSEELEAMPLERAEQITGEVHEFMKSVAQDITKDGPLAWQRKFADTPAFFMASEGRLIFANGAEASAGIQHLPEIIKQIELRWGDDLRVDPLALGLAAVGATYHEMRVDPAGVSMDESGYFTGVVEHQHGRWQFRDAHWSLVTPPPPAH